MPHMMPMIWALMLISSLMMLTLISMMTYFIFYPTSKTIIKTEENQIMYSNTYKWIWKWQ